MIAPSYTLSRVPDVDPEVGATPWPVTPLRAALTAPELVILRHVEAGGHWRDVYQREAAKAVRARGLVRVVVGGGAGVWLTYEGERALGVAT